MSDEEKAQELISIFVCGKDFDIESFIKEKAIQFEKLGKSRTFLIFNEDENQRNALHNRQTPPLGTTVFCYLIFTFIMQGVCKRIRTLI